ncbi:portal protein [Alteromonas phage ZP6]|uniref:Putative portal protein n=1 Tax=Alteromonas phage ZP6 TaxID=2492447 RepID=A0A3S9U8B3_9CAUD|nr:portal protein [Alteromonas phage ZP6]AZS06555.1 portal protein [Alteromonas phage ZP6]
MTPEAIIKRVSQLESDRQNVENKWEQIGTYVVPHRGEFYKDNNSENEVDWTNPELFDSTAVRACTILASSIHGALTNPSVRWFDLRFRDDQLNKNTDAASWLNKAAQTMYFAIQDSNFNLEIGETYTDICSFGSSFPSLEQEGKGAETSLVFGTIPLNECFFEEDHKGNVKCFYRKLEWTVSQIESKFKELPDSLKEKDSTDKVNLIYCIYQRDNYSEATSSVAETRRRYGYKYIMCNTKEVIGKEGGYYEMPVWIARWRKAADSRWGYSPAMISMPDIRTLNKLVEIILTAAEKAIDPPMKATERGLMSDLDLSAGGLTMVRDMEGLMPLESRARFDVSQLQREQLMSSIRECFHVDELQLKNSPAMTATEVQVRYELMQRMLGPTVGRLQSDVLGPMLQRVFNILYREGLLPDMPDGVDSSVDIQYTGPLARAQKSDLAMSTERWLQGVAQLSEMFPEARMYPDLDYIIREQGDNLNLPPQYIRSKDVIEQEKKAQQESFAEQQQLGAAQQTGQAMEAIGKGAQAMGGSNGQ